MTSAPSTPSRSVTISASNMVRRVPLRGLERRAPRLTRTRRAETERALVQCIELALPLASHAHDFEVAQDAQLVRGRRERNADQVRQLAHARLLKGERVHEPASRRIAERTEHARQAVDLAVIVQGLAQQLRSPLAYRVRRGGGSSRGDGGGGFTPGPLPRGDAAPALRVNS